MKAAIAPDPTATAHVDQWLSHITNPRNTHWDTTDSAYSGPFWALSQAVAGGQGMPSVDDFAAVAALGGGWRFADLTAEQFGAQRTESQIRSTWIARSAVVAEGIHSGTITTIEQILAVIGGE
jgi:hypothetical protein